MKVLNPLFLIDSQVKAIIGPWIQIVRRCLTMATSGGRGREDLTHLMGLESQTKQRSKAAVAASQEPQSPLMWSVWALLNYHVLWVLWMIANLPAWTPVVVSLLLFPPWTPRSLAEITSPGSFLEGWDLNSHMEDRMGPAWALALPPALIKLQDSNSILSPTPGWITMQVLLVASRVGSALLSWAPSVWTIWFIAEKGQKCKVMMKIASA